MCITNNYVEFTAGEFADCAENIIIKVFVAQKIMNENEMCDSIFAVYAV